MGDITPVIGDAHCLIYGKLKKPTVETAGLYDCLLYEKFYYQNLYTAASKKLAVPFLVKAPSLSA